MNRLICLQFLTIVPVIRFLCFCAFFHIDNRQQRLVRIMVYYGFSKIKCVLITSRWRTHTKINQLHRRLCLKCTFIYLNVGYIQKVPTKNSTVQYSWKSVEARELCFLAALLMFSFSYLYIVILLRKLVYFLRCRYASCLAWQGCTCIKTIIFKQKSRTNLHVC